MSYPYRVVISHSISESVTIEDESRNDVILTEYLPKERMKDILRDALERRGWTKVDDDHYAREGDRGETMVFDLEEGAVITSVNITETMEKEKTVTARGAGRSHARKAELRERVKQKLEKQLKFTEEERTEKKDEIQEKASQVLSETENSRKEELNDILMDVYAESLREKAKTLGQVVSIEENRSDDGTVFEMQIKIEE
ncbi:MAG: hypothetical protein E3J72_15220 [Planctomycetota bacterium]|nr:MAG: hypothetical protein E3J72_15220 [Planctomycetota bacterium]